MRNRTLLFSTLALGAIALALVFTGRETPPPAAQSYNLVPPELLADLRAIEVTANEKTVRIERTEKGWVVPSRFNLPVDTDNRLRPFLQALRNTKVLGTLTSDPRRIAKLNFAGNSIRVEAANGKSWSAEFGRTVEDGSGGAVRLLDAKEALRTTFTGYLEGDPANWINPVIFVMKREEVKGVKVTFTDGATIALAREKVGEPLKGNVEPKLAAASEELLNALSILRAADAIAPNDAEATAALARPFTVEVTLFSGETVTVRMAKAPAGKPGEPPRGWMTVAHSDAAHAMNQLSKQALYTCPPWLAEQVAGSAAELAKRMDPPEDGQDGTPTLQIPQGIR
jgi:hypothetical protein